MVDRLLDYFYTLSYSDNPGPAPAPVAASASPPGERQAGSLIVNASMYALGDKYDVPPLKDLARGRFAADTKIQWNSEDILELVDVVYNTTPETDRSLRDCMREMLREHGKEMFEGQKFKDAVKGNAYFALDVATAAFSNRPVLQCCLSSCSRKADYDFGVCTPHGTLLSRYNRV